MKKDTNSIIILCVFGTKITKTTQEYLNYCSIVGAEYGVTVIPKFIELLEFNIEALIRERQEARANRDFATADRIRDELAAQGIKLLDTKDGVRWTRD